MNEEIQTHVEYLSLQNILPTAAYDIWKGQVRFHIYISRLETTLKIT